jgi:hypothetical protein
MNEIKVVTGKGKNEKTRLNRRSQKKGKNMKKRKEQGIKN